jgi:hypothetical protein
MVEMRNAYRILSEDLKGRDHFRWEDDIKIDLKETEWEIVDWTHLAQDMDQ